MSKGKPLKNKSKILLIESKRARAHSFTAQLMEKGFLVSSAHSMQEALDRIDEDVVDVAILDAASMRTSGVRMSRALQEYLNEIPLILITPREDLISKDGLASSVLTHPLTVRKLANRITRFLPGKQQDIIQSGPIRLNIFKSTVRCHGKLTRLTPRLVSLLRLFIERKNHLITREDLLKIVWRTDYLGDTRMLDVHISWLRKAIECEPANPQLIKTLRGVGYRLEVTDQIERALTEGL